MEEFRINDDAMYTYFEDLLYPAHRALEGNGGRSLPQSWEKKDSFAPYGLTDRQVRMIGGAKSLLYERKDAERQLCLIQTFQKFLHKYIGIEGLEELLVNNYGVIENGIFFEYDEWGRSKQIREHAKHQMKNAFLGSVLLLEYGYLEDMVRAIKLERGIASEYLVARAKEEVEKGREEEDPERENPEGEDPLGARLAQWAYKIFVLASLFHDIGYPLEFYLRMSQKLADYPPHLKILSPISKADFSEIKACLLESQLLKQTDHDEIRRKYEANDHGVLSAISLLMHFYYSGRIYSLPREDRCIIEMTAIAIYHHTDKFCEGTRMVYVRDPISYMVRLCDDLQEWDRFKLSINDKHNYLQCDVCGKILLEKGKKYTCSGCGRSYRKITQLGNRKVNYICLCEELVIEKKSDKIKIRFQFDLMKQMEILLDDYKAVFKHQKDIEAVKKMLRDQDMRPKLELEYFLSNNPLFLIQKMIGSRAESARVEEWIDKLEGEKGKYMKAFYQDYQQKLENRAFGGQLEKNELKYKEVAQEYVREYYGEIFSLYQFLFD